MRYMFHGSYLSIYSSYYPHPFGGKDLNIDTRNARLAIGHVAEVGGAGVVEDVGVNGLVRGGGGRHGLATQAGHSGFTPKRA